MVSAIIISILGVVILHTHPRTTSTNLTLTISGNTALLTHTGGDPLPCDRVTVLLDGEPLPLALAGTDCPWSIGETLAVPLGPGDSPHSISVVYAKGDTRQEIVRADIPGLPAGAPTPVTLPETIATTALPTPSLTPALTLPPTPASPPGPPVASFNATPRSGPVPLAVQFTDTSTGVPSRWTWSFGDGKTSSLQNPLHTYTREGTYPVGLTVENEYGGHTRVNQGYITVTAAGSREVYLEAGRDARVCPGGFLEFGVTREPSRIRVGGKIIDIPAGARVRLDLPLGGKGKVSIRDDQVIDFSFDSVTLSLDGEPVAQGLVRDVSIQGYDSLISSLCLSVSGGDGKVRILEGGVLVGIPDERSPVVLTSLRPGSSGAMTLDCSREGFVSFGGRVTDYSFS
ncbi:MAG: PKD domain-containing protein [Methanolinea sp.]|nr:PKD domain-containing protein [Methanolinea sp.]